MRIDPISRRMVSAAFGLSEQRESAAGEELAPGAVPGYPDLAQVSFFLSCAALEKRIRERTLFFPNACCVCEAPPALFLPSSEPPSLLPFRRRIVQVTQIPHCPEHGRDRQAKLVSRINAFGPGAIRATLFGLNCEFLAETARLNSQGDVVPPWRAFPKYGPDSGGWRQGDGEFWLATVWNPFWEGLAEEERRDYLRRQDAPPEWKDFLEALVVLRR